MTCLDRADPPLLILVGDRDTLMTQRQSRRLHEAAAATGLRSGLHVIPEAGHGGTAFSNPVRRQLILRFLDSLSS